MPSRRAFLRAGGLVAAAVGVGGTALLLRRPGAGPAAVAPGPSIRRRVLVVLFQRGGLDGLMAVQPLSDPPLHRLRPHLVLDATSRADAAERLVDLDGRYGLHPALGPLAPLFREGRLAVVHGVGTPARIASHVEAQRAVASGAPEEPASERGWLGRAVGLMDGEAEPLAAVAPGSIVPLVLRGPHAALALGHAEAGLIEPDAAALLGDRLAGAYRPEGGAQYFGTPLGHGLRLLARLVKAEVGLAVAFVEAGGWDTHARQGGADGLFARRADDFARNLAAFWADLERYHDDVAVFTTTEFGRAVAENAHGGTEHGRASALFALGNAVAGGRVHGEPLALDALDGGGLPVTTDVRAVFAGIAGPHLGLADDTALFPGWGGARLPLIRAAA